MDKQIFKYTLDGETRYADPLAVWNSLTVALNGDPFAACEQAASEEGKSEAQIAHATQQLCRAVMEAFNLPPFDDKTGLGATVADALRIWNQLIDFNGACKKKSVC